MNRTAIHEYVVQFTWRGQSHCTLYHSLSEKKKHFIILLPLLHHYCHCIPLCLSHSLRCSSITKPPIKSQSATDWDALVVVITKICLQLQKPLLQSQYSCNDKSRGGGGRGVLSWSSENHCSGLRAIPGWLLICMDARRRNSLMTHNLTMCVCVFFVSTGM